MSAFGFSPVNKINLNPADLEMDDVKAIRLSWSFQGGGRIGSNFKLSYAERTHNCYKIIIEIS